SGKGDQRDEVDYQTAFARHEGSVAAPTAGLHFTEELLDVLKRRGVEIVEVTLHVGSASFLSVWAEEQSGEVAFSPPGVERGRIEQETLERLRQLKLEGRRIIAVGTTVVRLLETIFSSLNPHAGGEVRTDLFIRPGYRFRAVDSMITNFHQPQSSHLLLVEAFMGRSLLKESYEAAVQSRYRFLSYGDGMFIE
ncbi:MAG: S-adenosylmethionine:tRNA ribosyltransferase-isomerase, partial [Bdellovibrionales bacterium]|nr:S-adenosylmethionine:tRNA ribosyltransferase-isomerase [Bdellovibrionales bacterium]